MTDQGHCNKFHLQDHIGKDAAWDWI